MPVGSRPVMAGYLFVAAAAIGCGGSNSGHGFTSGMRPVNGVVTLEGQKDLAPLREAAVTFRSTGTPPVEARGAINPDEGGAFDLSTEQKQGDQVTIRRGVPDGEYLVRIETPNPRVVPAKYREFDTSGWKFTVGSGENHFALKIDPKK